MRFRALAGVALAVSLALSAAATTAAPAKSQPRNKQKVGQKNQTTGHAHHLLKAEEQLVEAEAALAARNASKAQQHVTGALKQVQEAIAHHHKHHISTMSGGSGFSGSFRRGAHHKHHATLKQAESELIAAERALQSGSGAQASKDITKAAKTIKNAIASHHHLFGKT